MAVNYWLVSFAVTLAVITLPYILQCLHPQTTSHRNRTQTHHQCVYATHQHQSSHGEHELQRTSHDKRTVFEEKIIRQTLNSPADSIIATHRNLSIKQKDLLTLADGRWLNDEVVNFYCQLLSARYAHRNRVLVFNSFWYTKLTENGYSYANVRRWTRCDKLQKHAGMQSIRDIFDVKKVIIPINLGNTHWVCGCINVEQKRIEYYDSMYGNNRAFFSNMRRYLIDEYNDKQVMHRNYNLNLNEWQNVFNDRCYPQQSSSCDCGVFTLKCADSICQNARFDFSQAQMSYLRKEIMLELINSAVH